MKNDLQLFSFCFKRSSGHSAQICEIHNIVIGEMNRQKLARDEHTHTHTHSAQHSLIFRIGHKTCHHTLERREFVSTHS